MKLVIASHNQKKIAEMRTLLSQFCPQVELLSLDDVGLTDDIEETGVTFTDNAYLKAEAIAKHGYAAVADDSGLCVDALDGAPGVFSARYAGEDANDARNNEKLLGALAGLPAEKRTAHFTSVIVCLIPGDPEPIIAKGRCDGIILEAPRGDGGFGYDPLFLCPDYQKTFAQMTPAEKHAVSHRGKAMRAFAVALAMKQGGNG